MAIAALALAVAAPARSTQDVLPVWEVPGSAMVSGDWAFGCDNEFSCTLSNLGGEGEGDWIEGLRIDFLVAAAPDGPPFAMLTVSASPANDVGAEESWAIPSMVRSVALDGKVLPLVDMDEDHGHDASAVRWLVSLDELGRMARGKAITLQDEDGTVVETISTRGLHDGLRHIERLKAYFPQEIPRWPPVTYEMPHVMPPGRLPPFSPRLAVAMQREAGCPELDLALEERPMGIFQTRIGLHDVLVRVSCASAGPAGVTGPSFVLPLILDQRDGSVSFARFDIAPWNPDFARETLVPDAYFDDDEMVLHTFGYLRDFGDCGERADYVWDAGARRFVLIGKWAMPSCRTASTWIRTYQRPAELRIID